MPNKLSGWSCVIALILVLTISLSAQPPLAGDSTFISATRKNFTASDPEYKLRLHTDVVSLDVNVIDRQGRPIIGLEAQQFEIYEDGIKQNIEYFRLTDIPASIGVIFDVSGSMNSRLKEAQEAFKTFITTSHAEDDYFLVLVQDKPQLVLDFTGGDELLRKVSSLKAEGNTALQDAVALGLEKLQQSRHQKRALLVISDGVDNYSRLDYRKLLQLAKESAAQIYTIGTADFNGVNCGAVCRLEAQQLMTGIARQTGGEAIFLTSQKHLEDATYRIALLLRQQYSFGYFPTNERRGGKWRKVEIKVKEVDQKAIIRTRRGYYD